MKKHGKECTLCGEKIYNKKKNAKYCKICTLIIRRITSGISTTASNLRQCYPNLTISYKLQIKKQGLNEKGTTSTIKESSI